MNYTGMGFGGGFASGLANALAMKQQRDAQAKERQIANTWKSIGFLVDSGQVKDIADLQPHFDTLTNLGAFGDPKAKGKGPTVQDHASAILGHILRSQPGQGRPMDEVPQPEAQVGPNDAGDVMPPAEQPLVGRPLSYPPVAPPMPRTLNGIPLLTPEEVTQRGIDQLGTKQIALVNLARERILPALKAVDPSASLDDALAAVGVRLPRASAALGPKSIAGEVDGKPTFAVFVNGKYVDPQSGEPIPNFAPKTPAATQSVGTALNAKLKEMFPDTPLNKITGEQMAQAQQAVTDQMAERAGATTTARGNAAAGVPLSSANRFQALRNLQEDWRKVDKPVKEVKRQFDIMQTGLKRFKEGDRNGGSQAVLVTFQKILDPNSVVRESEYDRSPEGVGLKDRMLGWVERLKSGGAGVPAAQLEEMVKTAKEFVDGLDEYNALERERISGAAKEAGLEPGRVFGVADVDAEQPTPKGSGAAKGGGAKATVPGLYIDANGNLVTGAAPTLPAMRPAVGHGAR